MNAIYLSVKRAALRITLLAWLGTLMISSSQLVPLFLGPTLAPLAFGFGLCFLGLAVGDLAMRILQPNVDAQMAAKRATYEANVGAGLVYLGRCILAAAILMLIVTAPRAAEPPAASLQYLPILKAEQVAWWPQHPMPSTLGAQVEQETCITLTHRKCWNPRAELNTSRERGVGLGQITKTSRFDSLAEMKAAFPSALAAWGWESASLYDPRMQLRGLILMGFRNWRQLTDVPNPNERLAMTLASYNGGLRGLSMDRTACAGTKGCNPAKWWGNVEHTSLKAKTAVAGYGKSFFEINREYVSNVVKVRRARYLSLDA